MKKRVALTITLSLLLAISTIAVLAASNTNQSPTLLNSTPNNLGTITKPYTGSGDPLNALLYITNVYNNAPNGTNTSSDIYIPCPNGWKIIWANLTLTDINAPNATIEPNPNPFNGDTEITFLAMSFRLTNDAYLDNVSVYLRAPGGGSIAHFYVYDAVEGGGVPIPNNLIKNISSVSIPAGNPIWFDLNFGHQTLNTSSTYSNTFFIGIENIDSSKFYWKHVAPASGGYAYQYQSGVWSPLDVDFKLKVNVSDIFLPSEVGLTINGSMVSDVSRGDGNWNSSNETSSATGYIFYDVASTWWAPVSFSYIWNVTYAKNSIALTNFIVYNNTDAFWNVTIDATDAFPLTSTGVNHINITGVPSDWGDSSSMAFDGINWVTLDSHPPDTISFIAGNGTWTVNCTAPNYLSSIGFMMGENPVENATLEDLLNIAVSFDASVSGSATLRIYDPSQRLNYTDTKTLSGVAGVVFGWNVSSTATTDGVFNVTVSFVGGLSVGYNETALEIVPLIVTGLVVTSFPTSIEYPNTVPITLYYYDNETGLGLAGATITAYEGAKVLPIYNRTDYGNGTYSFILDFGTDFGVHEVRFVASGVRFYASSASNTITINFKAPYYVVINPEITGLILLMSNMLGEQNQKIVRYLVLGAVLGSVAVGGLVANRVRRRRLVPLRAMASLENIILDHIPSGVTVWAFDFYKMEQDASLVSGFMSAVKTFLGEMRKGGLRKLETEFGTFIREDGNLLTATCITSGVTAEEEKWIRGKLREFVSRAEEQNWEKFVDWKGEVSHFKASLLEILSSLIDLDKAEALQREKIMKLLREREKLQEELNTLGAKLQKLNQEYREGKISEMDFTTRKAQMEPKYDKVQMDYIRASIILSKVPYTIESMWEVAQDKEGIETIRDRFIEIRMQIDELQKKEQGGIITAKELKRKEKLQKELMSLIEKLDKRRVK
ncbi:MAG: hypothetical protein KIH08_10150 [Candidatus Freyarchaeota archaeon]|nr:hypothetical protein [Candidatus Jordarchaeia archaeon]MBS7270002.1 hypothetical protein [Candidatus Jordarchaeia archaeon]MBS7281099.1 hypothetical protein [Candidatus Jordarchaeia archaeon]